MAPVRRHLSEPTSRAGSSVRWGCIGAVIAGALAVIVGTFVALPSVFDRMRTTLTGYTPDERFRGAPTAPRPMRVPLPEPPATLPMIGAEGTGADGYPLRGVDAVGLRSLLDARRFDDLTRYLEQIEADVESDFHHEYWMSDALQAFSTADPRVGERIAEWAAHAPQSFAPALAAAEHESALALELRGTAVVRDTSAGRLDAMHRHLASARQSYTAALARRPRLLAADVGLIHVAVFSGDHALRDGAYAHALATCPLCTLPRRMMVTYSVARWGGSQARTEALVADAVAHERDNPRLGAFRGYVAWRRCDELQMHARWDDALAACSAAIAAGQLEDFYWDRADTYERLDRDVEALADFARARQLRPGSLIRAAREFDSSLGAERAADASALFVRALQLDPTDLELQERVATASQAAAYAGWRAFQAGRSRDAFELLDRAVALDPGNGDAHQRRGWVSHQFNVAHASEAAALEARVRQSPGDFWAVHDLDHATNGGPAVSPAWNAYIALHPFDARGWSERAGWRHNHGDGHGAQHDLRAACELGDREACSHIDPRVAP